MRIKNDAGKFSLLLQLRELYFSFLIHTYTILTTESNFEITEFLYLNTITLIRFTFNNFHITSYSLLNSVH